jgi:hypothetical protein
MLVYSTRFAKTVAAAVEGLDMVPTFDRPLLEKPHHHNIWISRTSSRPVVLSEPQSFKKTAVYPWRESSAFPNWELAPEISLIYGTWDGIAFSLFNAAAGWHETPSYRRF